MKTNILVGAMVVGSVLGVIFGGYLLISFMFWVLSDPLDLIHPQEIETTQGYKTYEQAEREIREKEFKICTDKGGIPISSIWDGRLKRCDGLTS